MHAVKPKPLLAALVLGVAFFAAAQVRSGRTADEQGIHRSLLVDQPTVQAVRVTYEAGATEPAGVHSYDVVLVPLNHGAVRLNVPDQPDPEWKPGTAIFIKRGTQHRLVNSGETPIEFITLRIP